MIGDLVFDDGELLEIVWDGEADRACVVPPLCVRMARIGSPLAPLVQEQYAVEARGHNRPKERNTHLSTQAIRRARRELRELAGFRVVKR